MHRNLTLCLMLVTHGPELLCEQILPGTTLWDDRGSSKEAAGSMVEGLHHYLDQRLKSSVNRRERHWNRDLTSPESYSKSVEPNRLRLARMIGAVESRAPDPQMELIATVDNPALIAEAEHFRVFRVRWDLYEDVQAEGLLLIPNSNPLADVVAIPDADITPEHYVGLAGGLESSSEVPRLLAEAGCRVVVPVLIDRGTTFSGNPEVRMTNLTHREWIWRQGFEAGRHPIGFEVEAVRAAVDWLESTAAQGRPMGLVGYGEGGLIALCAGALDQRVNTTLVGGYFGSGARAWEAPIDRDLWGWLDEFGDAEVASLIVPRSLIIEASAGPEIDGPPAPVNGRSLAASGFLKGPSVDEAQDEFLRFNELTTVPGRQSPQILTWNERHGHNHDDLARRVFLERLLAGSNRAGDEGGSVEEPPDLVTRRTQFETLETNWLTTEALPDPNERMGRWVRALESHIQRLIRVSELRRNELWAIGDRSSVESWSASTNSLRELFRDDVIGSLPPASVPLHARSIKLIDEPSFEGFGVEIPVWEGVIASGILLIPRGIAEGDRRPVVVCQHGLESTPDPVVDPSIPSSYNGYGARLAELGYIVYAPQNPYIGVDRFRQLQRKAHPLKTSLFSIIVRQHEQTLEWLRTLAAVDPDRIAFYGLSYGGKTAMRVPALVDGYCLSICSADFNEWVVKCTNLVRQSSYMYTIEYDMYEWDLAHRANYAEMAGYIAPRPFMVERGHDDGVASDEWVAYEFAKVRELYDDLGIGDRAAITFFNGGHQIQGEATFEFLTDHLDWPPKR